MVRASVAEITKDYHRLQIRYDQRMRPLRARRKLRQEQGSDKEPMVRQLYHTHLSFLIHSGALQRSAQDLFSVDWIEAEVTVKLFHCLFPAIRLVRLRPFRQPYRLCLPYG